MARRVFRTGLTTLFVAVIFAAAFSTSVAAEESTTGGTPTYKALAVKTPDGPTVRAQIWGNASGTEILFIHGFSQSYLSWIKQTGGDLPKTFRMVTYDLRGHGGSDKPLDAKYYQNDKAWADEVAAVMQAAGLKRPLIVAWSYGGRVVGNYLKFYGDAHIAGLNLVDIRTKTNPDWDGDVTRNTAAAMVSPDIATNIAGTEAFVRGVTAAPLSAQDFEQALGYNMVVPVEVRAAMRGGQNQVIDFTDVFKKVKVPALVTHGAKDDLIKLDAAKYTASVIPGAKLSIYEGAGHAPFLEESARFNRELAELALKAAGKH